MNEETKQTEETRTPAPEETESKVDAVSPDTAPEESRADAPADAVAQELEALKTQHLYLLAEYDNFRKRTAREKETAYRNAAADTVGAFLPVYDNLERAAAGLAEDDPHRQGLELICKQYRDCLEKCGVTEIDALGKPFDPERMNAVMHGEDETLGENTVAEVLQKGFILGDKVLRFAMVRVVN